MSKKFDEIETRLRAAESDRDRLVKSCSATARDALNHGDRIRALEDTLIKAGILVEIKDTPPVVADVTTLREVLNPSLFAFLKPSPYMKSTKNYKVVVPNQQKYATGEPKKKGSK